MYKVLIVEDMDLTREDLISLIDWERYGFELLPDARNGKIGLEYAKRYRPDIVITDIKMPVMTGLDLVAQMKKVADEVKNEMVSLASVLAGKVIGNTIDAAAQDSLIDETLKEIGDSTWLS